MVSKILEIFSHNGELSSKRIGGFMLIISGIVLCFTYYEKTLCLGVISIGAGLLGFTSVEKIFEDKDNSNNVCAKENTDNNSNNITTKEDTGNDVAK
jgi:hypothetical protein